MYKKNKIKLHIIKKESLAIYKICTGVKKSSCCKTKNKMHVRSHILHAKCYKYLNKFSITMSSPSFLPINDWAGCSECPHTPGRRFLLWISNHQGTLQQNTKHIFTPKTDKNSNHRQVEHYNEICFTNMDSDCIVPIFKPRSSICFLCFRYMGHTWPSNRPGGSGTVYCLLLKS